jgi:hypothetical protein
MLHYKLRLHLEWGVCRQLLTQTVVSSLEITFSRACGKFKQGVSFVSLSIQSITVCHSRQTLDLLQLFDKYHFIVFFYLAQSGKGLYKWYRACWLCHRAICKMLTFRRNINCCHLIQDKHFCPVGICSEIISDHLTDTLGTVNGAVIKT